MRILFMGTPDIAAECLKALYAAGHDICAVYTRRDKPVGRKQVLTAPPVKEVALAHGTPVFQPRTLRDGSEDDTIRALAPELIVVVAYGCILPKSVLEMPRYGCINLHVSLLPKYRGAAPIQWAVLNGDAVTGVSTMYLDREMDTGDVIYTEQTPVGEFETAGELFDRLAVMGADLLVRTLRDVDAGVAPRTPQDHSAATYTRPLTRDDSPIDWDQSPRAIIKHICGLEPWPVATAELGGQTFKIHAADYSDRTTQKAPGTIVAAGKDGVTVACADGQTVRITQLQAPGKKRMSAADYLLGHTLPVEG